MALLSGYLAGKYFKNLTLGILVGLCGGFLIDLDHVLEYFLVYGFHFNPSYFLQGRQFLISDQLHLWFHAWEYVPILIFFGWLFRKKETLKAILFTLAFTGSLHLFTDCIINQVPLKFYSLSYRASQNFSTLKLMTPEAYQNNLALKKKLGL